MAENLNPQSKLPATQQSAQGCWTRGEILLRLVAKLEARNIPYVVAGDTSRFPEHIQSDADLIVPQDFIAGTRAFMRGFCDEIGVLLVQEIENEPCSWSYFLAWKGANSPFEFFVVDFCADYCRMGRRLLSAEQVLRGRRPALSATGESKGFFIPAAEEGFAYYLIKKVEKGDLGLEHGPYLSGQWQQASSAARKRIAGLWTEEEVAAIARAAADNNWTEIQRRGPELKRSLKQHLPSSLKARLFYLGRTIRRVWHPSGFLVAVFGPDGSGKSTVIEGASTALLPVFRRRKIFHLRPKFGRDEASQGPNTDPHRQAPRGLISSVIKLAYLWADYAVGYFTAVRPRLVRTTLVMFDRYYEDLLVDPRRYRFQQPMWLAGLVSKFIPHPELYLLLDAPAEVLQARKQEVALAETARQRAAYRGLFENRPRHVIISAHAPVPEVVAAVQHAVLTAMAERIRNRFNARS